jgi:hypothetical protein
LYQPGVSVLLWLENASRLITMLSVLVGAVALSAIFILHLHWNLNVMSHKTYAIHVRLIVFIVVQVNIREGV